MEGGQQSTVGGITSAAYVTIAGLGAMIAALWFPWHWSGPRGRSAFYLSEAIDRLDVTAWAGLWAWTLPLAPIVGAIGWLALVTGRVRVAAILTGLVLLIVGVPAVASLFVSELRAAGQWIASAGALAAAVGLVLLSQARGKQGGVRAAAQRGNND